MLICGFSTLRSVNVLKALGGVLSADFHPCKFKKFREEAREAAEQFVDDMHMVVGLFLYITVKCYCDVFLLSLSIGCCL